MEKLKTTSYLPQSITSFLCLLLISALMGACQTATPNPQPVVTVVEKTVLVVVTATNLPATATPVASPTTAATDTPAASPASSMTPSPTAIALTPTPTGPTPTPYPTVTKTYAIPPTLVPLQAVGAPGSINGELRFLPTASIAMRAEYYPYINASSPTITKVTFEIFRGTKRVFSSQTTTSPYCAFGLSGSKCKVLIFGDYVNTWPNSHISVTNGQHILRVTIQDNQASNNVWSVDVPFTVQMP